MTREQVQEIALQKAKENNYNGVLVLTPGSGKSKVAIDCIKQGNFKNILITSPRTNLKESWRSELEKWGFHDCGEYWNFNAYGNCKYYITLENIQSCYKWSIEELKQFDFIIYDEIHTCGEEYYKLVARASLNHIPVLGLTGTPTLSDPWKKEVLYKTLPIIYEYYSAEEDGITNKIQYWKFEYELTDAYKVVAGTKTKKWYVGEAKQYTYLSEKYEEAKAKMFELGASDYFETSMLWMKGIQKQYLLVQTPNGTDMQLVDAEATKEQKEWGRKFFFAIKARKEFLWNLTSSKTIALEIKNKILNAKYSSIVEAENTLLGVLFTKQDGSKEMCRANKGNKVLLFSELTQQAEKLSPYSIHSNNGNSAKEAEVINKELLDRFNSGELRELSSCLSLTLGLNMVGTSHAVFESYSSSVTNFTQKSKRLARLSKDKTAHVVIIVPKGTQAETWASELLKGLDYITVTDLKDLKI